MNEKCKKKMISPTQVNNVCTVYTVHSMQYNDDYYYENFQIYTNIM